MGLVTSVQEAGAGGSHLRAAWSTECETLLKDGKENSVFGVGPLGSWFLLGSLPPAYSTASGPGTFGASIFIAGAAQVPGEKPVD